MKILPRAPLPLHCPHCNCRMVRRGPPGVRLGHDQAPTRDHIRPIAWGGADTPDNLRWCCKRCNEDRGLCGHCVGVLACVMTVKRSIGRSARHVIKRWRLRMPVRPRPPWPRAGDNPHLAQGGTNGEYQT